MEKIYIPSKSQCYSCDTTEDKQFRAVGFTHKPQRFVFCSACWLKWSGIANQMVRCPRKKIFKEVARREHD